MPKNLQTRRVPGFSPKFQDIQEISQSFSPESKVSLSQDSCDPLKEPYKVNEDTMSHLQKDLSKIILKLKKVPGSQDYVPYEDIKKFPQNTEEE